jgi:hypothetical protein
MGELPRIEADGSLSWLPRGAERLAELRVRRRQPDGTYLTTLHAAPAEVYRQGVRFYVRRPKRSDAWHTIELDADALGARVEEITTPAGPGAILTVDGAAGPQAPA